MCERKGPRLAGDVMMLACALAGLNRRSGRVRQFRLTNADELDDELASWLHDAYRVGRQETDDSDPRERS